MSGFVAVVSWLGFFYMLMALTFAPKEYWQGRVNPTFTLIVFFVLAIVASLINADYEVKERR